MASLEVRRGRLAATFRDNEQSPAVLSGIASLVHLDDASGRNAFDPDNPSAGAGANFEHITPGHPSPAGMFEPRHGLYRLDPAPDGDGVDLVRRAEESFWGLASTMRYRIVAPHYVDLDFCCRAADPARFGPRGWVQLFWANYMNDVEDVALRFRGVAREGGPEGWISADGPPGHPDWNQGGSYRHVSAAPLECDPGQKQRLNLWSYDQPRFTDPFFWGRCGGGMLFQMMFDRTAGQDDEVRFAIFKFKLKHHPRPAWDFQYVIRRVTPGREYGFRARMVWKRFVSEEDCLHEFRAWRAG